MKRYLYLVALVLVATFAHADFWTNCTNNGGTIIQANSYGNDKGGLCNDPNNPNLTNNCNGKRFCLSGKAMNWWSSFTWCESIGGKLASFTNMCPNVQILDNRVTGACPNLTNVANPTVYSSTGWQDTLAMLVTLSDGKVWNGWSPISRRGSANAFCEEK